MRFGGRFWRVLAGSAVLVVLGVLAVQLVPLYFRNLEFQRFLEDMAQDAASSNKPEDLVRVDILNKASEMGLPVRSRQVQVIRSDGRMRIEILYVVPVDLWLYTVDLHFHASAGRL